MLCASYLSLEGTNCIQSCGTPTIILYLEYHQIFGVSKPQCRQIRYRYARLLDSGAIMVNICIFINHRINTFKAHGQSSCQKFLVFTARCQITLS